MSPQEKEKAEEINAQARRKLEDYRVPDVREQNMFVHLLCVCIHCMYHLPKHALCR